MRKFCRLILFYLLFCFDTQGQGDHFFWGSDTILLEVDTNPWQSFTYGTQNGLLSPEILCLEQAKNGFLWIGTSSGLSRFDGRNFENFLSAGKQELGRVMAIREDTINAVMWIAGSKGLFFYKNDSLQPVYFKKKEVAFNDMHIIPGYGIWLASSIGPFYIDYKTIPVSPADARFPLEIKVLNEWNEYFKGLAPALKIISCPNENIYIAGENKLYLYHPGRFSKIWEAENPTINHDEIIGLAAEENTLYFASAFKGLHSVIGEKVRKIKVPGYIASGLTIKHQQVYYFTSGGIYQSGINADSMVKISEVAEDLNLWPGCLFMDDENNIWLGMHDNLVYQKPRAIYILEPVVRDFDLELYSILQLKNGSLLFGANRGKVYQKKGLQLSNYLGKRRAVPLSEIKAMYEDTRGWLWLGSGYEGISVLQNKKIKHITKKQGLPTDNNYFFYEDSSGNIYTGGDGAVSKVSFDVASGKFVFKNYYYRREGQHFETFKSCIPGPDGTLWLVGQEGIFRLNKDHLQKYYLDEGGDVNVSGMIKDRKGDVWLATRSAGIWQCYFDDKNLLKLKRVLTKKEGLSSGIYLSIVEGKDNKIWAAGYGGLTSLEQIDNQVAINNFTIGNGFPISNYQSIKLYTGLADTLWIATSSGLSFLKMRDVTIPVKKIKLSITGIYFFEAGKEHLLKTQLPGEDIVLPYRYDNLEIRFKAISLSYPQNIQYSYRLLGLPDTSWLDWMDKERVIFQNLPAGKYSFELKARGEEGLHSGPVNFTFQIEKPFWLTTWFKVLAGLIIASLLYFSGRLWKKGINARHEEKLNQEKQISENLHFRLVEEQVTNYFTHFISSSSSESELLWDVCKQCISKLNFEDCVIYLVNESTQNLEQEAAWGPKQTEDKRLKKQIILSPISISVGEGIVGSVAACGRPEIVNDLRGDSRYIVDDAKRLSEIAVPIMFEGKVMGVIDSENSQKNFYTPHHLQILTSIASHCAERIVKLRAEKNLQKNKIQLLETQQRLAEERLTALRSQMNPHFIFNCLNSIQQFILIGDVDKANKFLSQFSKLIRMVLQNSESNLITLHEEINILQLYLSLEKTRFGESFEYKIFCEEVVETEEISIPNLMIQPFVENAIWHGLMHKEKDRKLSVHFRELEDNILECLILDNGIGRKRAEEIKNQHSVKLHHTSKGIQLVKDKITVLKSQYGYEPAIEIEDILEEGKMAGTRVCIRIPIYS